MVDESKWGEASLGYDPLLLERFRARASDVFINTAPKAGTTWMQQILHQLRGGEEFDSMYDVVPWIEFPGRLGETTDQRLTRYEALGEPRVFKAHLPYERTPGVDAAKFVIVARDPRDRCVSAYHHMVDMTDEFCAWLSVTRPASFGAFFDEWITRPRYNDHVRSWWEHRGDKNVHWVRYEDLKRAFDTTVRGIVAFLGWAVDDEAMARVEERAGFEWMSEHWDKFARFSGGEEPSWKPKTFVRRGAVGDHRTTLSSEQEARIIEQCQGALTEECRTYLGLP